VVDGPAYLTHVPHAVSPRQVCSRAFPPCDSHLAF
jgi:hypothetical protein